MRGAALPSHPDGAFTHALRLVLGMVIVAALPSVATSQVAPVTVAAPVADSLPPFERPNGALLRTGSLTYLLSLTKAGGATIALGTRTVTVSETQLGGTPGWLVADAKMGTAVPTFDSAYVARDDLAPARWNAINGPARLGVSFSRDSAFGAIDGYQGRTSFALAVPSNLLLSTGMLERVLESLPLREGYHAAASLLLADGASVRVVPAEIVVGSAEPVAVGARDVPAWRVLLRWGASEQRLWVARDVARVLKTEQSLPDGVFTSVLQQP